MFFKLLLKGVVECGRTAEDDQSVVAGLWEAELLQLGEVGSSSDELVSLGGDLFLSLSSDRKLHVDVAHLTVNLHQLLFDQNVAKSLVTVEELDIARLISSEVHCLHDLVDWRDSCATSNESDLGLLPDLAKKTEVSVTKVGDLAEWWAELCLLADGHGVEVLSQLVVGVLLSLFVDLDDEVDCALLIDWGDGGVGLARRLAVWFVEDKEMLRDGRTNGPLWIWELEGHLNGIS